MSHLLETLHKEYLQICEKRDQQNGEEKKEEGEEKKEASDDGTLVLFLECLHQIATRYISGVLSSALPRSQEMVLFRTSADDAPFVPEKVSQFNH